MTNKPRGIYRIHEMEGAPPKVYLSYGRHGFVIAATEYLERGHEPPFDSLPWEPYVDPAQAAISPEA